MPVVAVPEPGGLAHNHSCPGHFGLLQCFLQDHLETTTGVWNAAACTVLSAPYSAHMKEISSFFPGAIQGAD